MGMGGDSLHFPRLLTYLVTISERFISISLLLTKYYIYTYQSSTDTIIPELVYELLTNPIFVLKKYLQWLCAMI